MPEPTMPSEQQLREFKQRLLRRSEELLEDIRRELRKSDNEQYQTLAGSVADTGDQSLADLLVDVNLAEIHRDVAEFREIEAALLRIADRSYGICVQCEEIIEGQRLQANAAASHCHRCQQALERRSPERRHSL